MTTGTFKVGTNKGRPRIWLDGKRLTEAGFVGGTVYHCVVWGGSIVLTLDDPFTTGAKSSSERKVTGRPDGKPIIDMLGRDVVAAFGEPAPERVTVHFAPRRIVVTVAS